MGYSFFIFFISGFKISSIVARTTIRASHQFRKSKKYFDIPKAVSLSTNSIMKIKVNNRFMYLKIDLISEDTRVSKARVIVLQITHSIIKFSKNFPEIKPLKPADNLAIP